MEFKAYFDVSVATHCACCGKRKVSKCAEDLDQELILTGWHVYNNELYCLECYVITSHPPTRVWCMTCDNCDVVYESSRIYERDAVKDLMQRFSVQHDGSVFCNACDEED